MPDICSFFFHLIRNRMLLSLTLDNKGNHPTFYFSVQTACQFILHAFGFYFFCRRWRYIDCISANIYSRIFTNIRAYSGIFPNLNSGIFGNIRAYSLGKLFVAGTVYVFHKSILNLVSFLQIKFDPHLA